MKRTLRLAKVAAQAEGLRLRRLISRQINRAIFGAIAAVFAIALLTAAHVALYIWMLSYVTPLQAVGIVAAVDLVFVVVFGFLAARNTPDSVEVEALRVREQARAQLADAMTLTAIVGPALRLAAGRKVFSMALAAMTARYLSGRRAT